jgi:hypothetical protein
LATSRGIATEGGSGLAVGSAEGDGEGLGVALDRLACADGAVIAMAMAKASTIKPIREYRFKNAVL